MHISKKVREIVLNKSDSHCWYCGCDLSDKWHVDHFEAVLRNSSNKNIPENPENDTIDNLVPACAPCNLWKKTFSIEQFRKELTKQAERLRRDSSAFRMAERYGLVKDTKLEIKFWFEKQAT